MQDNETLKLLSEYEEEWYGFIEICAKCHGRFMTSGTAEYCPYCGRKIIGFQKGKTTTFEFEVK